MPSNKYLRLTRILLTIGGCAMLLATVPIFFPPSTMQSIHQSLGMGDFPVQPITVYLAKSTSMLYAAHGLVLLFVTLQFQRYHGWVPFLGWLHVCLGFALLYIDISSSMPIWWLASEGPPVALLGFAVVFLYGKGTRKAST